MKHLFFSLTALFICLGLQAQDFGGSWGIKAPKDEDGTSWVFSLMLWKSNGKYIGDYVFTTQYGNSIEMGNVKMISQEGNKAKIQIKNENFGVRTNNYTIELLPNKTLKFCCPTPNKEYGLPTNVIMKRTRTEKELIEINKKWENR